MATIADSETFAKEEPNSSRSELLLLFAIFVLAVIARLVWRIYKGDQDFWTSGSTLFYELATNLAAGRGIGLEEGDRAPCVPGYPLFLALLAGKNYLWIVLPQALLGAGTAWCAYWIGKELFGRQVAVLAGFLTALYPFYVLNDTALQATGLFTFLTALSVFLLLRAKRAGSVMEWTLAGLMLGAAVLTSETLLPFAALTLAWVVFAGEGTLHRKVDRLIAVLAPVCLLIGLWMARNYMAVGSPVITSSFGRQLWNANNPKTFTHYPEENLERSADDALASLTLEERQDLDGISDEVLKSDWFEDKAVDYIQAHPMEALTGAFRKIVTAFSWNLKPKQQPAVQIFYLLSYGPIAILGVAGMVLTRRRWKEHSLIYLLFFSFAAVTAVLWAETRQRSYLDVYWIVFAAYVLHRLFGERHAASSSRT